MQNIVLDYEGKPIRKSLYKVFGTCPFCGGDLEGEIGWAYGVCNRCGAV